MRTTSIAHSTFLVVYQKNERHHLIFQTRQVFRFNFVANTQIQQMQNESTPSDKLNE